MKLFLVHFASVIVTVYMLLFNLWHSRFNFKVFLAAKAIYKAHVGYFWWIIRNPSEERDAMTERVIIEVQEIIEEKL